MDIVDGVEGLRPGHGPLFAVIGVFDGLHRGHAYLLEQLGREAELRSARPAVVTFDHHPDEVLTGTAPPLLMDPDERLERLAAAGVQVTVVQHFDDAVRRTPYDAFVAAISTRAGLAGLLMTPDAAFGFERRGTPAALVELGAREGFDVVIVAPFTLDGRPVRSSEVRAAISSGDLAAARDLLGRPVSIRALLEDGVVRSGWPLALPADGTYEARVGGSPATLHVAGGVLRLEGGAAASGAVEIELV